MHFMIFSFRSKQILHGEVHVLLINLSNKSYPTFNAVHIYKLIHLKNF